MPMFAQASHDVYSLMREIIDRDFPILAKLDPPLKISIAFVWSTGDTPALKVHGWPAFATVKATTAKERVHGAADVAICIDWDRFPRLDERTKEAILAHELYHLEPVCTWDRDSDSYSARLDSVGRPIVGLREHDFQFGGFREMAARYGDRSVEVMAVESAVRSLEQGTFAFNGEPAEDDSEHAA